MIGQQKVHGTINKVLDKFPRFCIVEGPKGSGKKTLVKDICNKLNLPIIECGTSIDDVRAIIDFARERFERQCYLFADADNMSLSAKNGLLKVTEEPPKNAYFMMTLQDKSNTLETILSRGAVFTLDPYSPEELISYRKYRQYSDTFDDIIKQICTNTGEVDELFCTDIPAFYNFAKTIVDYIHIPNTGNIFKISKQIKSKDTDKGFDGVLLFKAVRNLYIDKALQTNKKQYLLASNVTSTCIRDLCLPSINKVATVDKWIMDVRAVLRSP